MQDKCLSKRVIYVLIIVIVGFLAYSNTFHSPFQWDEADFILGNPIIRNLNYFTDVSRAEGLPVYDGFKSRYIGYLTFALNYRLHGFDVTGYHMVNLAIHIVNGILVYLLVLLTFRTPYFKGRNAADDSLFTIHFSRLFALAVALLFVVHPIQTEAVTYVFQRMASLVSMFYLLSLVLYIKGRQIQVEAKVKLEKDSNSTLRPHSSASSLTCFILSFLSTVLAMKTKENAFTLPVIITLYEFLFFSGPVKTRVLRLVPWLLTMLIVPLTIMGTGATPGEIISQVKDPASLGFITPTPQDYLFTQFRVIVTYIRLLFLPVGQNFDYDYPLYHSLFDLPVLLSFLLLAAVFGFAVYLLFKSHRAEGGEQEAGDTPLYPPLPRGEVKEVGFHALRFTLHASRLLGFGILWFFITLSVESSIIPIPMLINEYRVYLPSVGFFLALITGILLLVQRFPGASFQKARMFVAILAVIVLALAGSTYARNVLWKDKVSLWEDVVSKSPNSSRGYNNLGIAYYEKGRNDEAIRMYEHAIALNPRYLDAYMNLGVSYAVTGRLDAAIEKFSAVVEKDPKNDDAYLNLGRAYSDLRRPHEAIEYFRRATAVNPNNSAAFHGLGTAYARLGYLDDALAAFTRFVELSPRDPEAYRNRALVYQTKGDIANALEDFQQACSLGSRDGCEFLERARLR
jgi:tetratricopeptide (TPR) repeat protein